MGMIKEPSFSLIDVYPKCTNHFRDNKKKQLMNSIMDELIKDEKEYKERLKDESLYSIKKHETHHICIKEKDLQDLYKKKILNKSLPAARRFYDEIFLSSSICAFCGKRQTGTLDHFLSKSIYPNFSVTPINLVPSCTECNREKGTQDKKITSFNKQFIHPYEEDITTFNWMAANIIIEDENVIFKFYVRKLTDNILYQRIYNQFNILGLEKYFSVEAGVLFKDTKDFYSKLYLGKEIKELEDNLNTELEKYSYSKNHLNSFGAVYYKTLLDNLDEVLKVL